MAYGIIELGLPPLPRGGTPIQTGSRQPAQPAQRTATPHSRAPGFRVPAVRFSPARLPLPVLTQSSRRTSGGFAPVAPGAAAAGDDVAPAADAAATAPAATDSATPTIPSAAEPAAGGGGGGGGGAVRRDKGEVKLAPAKFKPLPKLSKPSAGHWLATGALLLLLL